MEVSQGRGLSVGWESWGWSQEVLLESGVRPERRRGSLSGTQSLGWVPRQRGQILTRRGWGMTRSLAEQIGGGARALVGELVGEGGQDLCNNARRGRVRAVAWESRGRGLSWLGKAEAGPDYDAGVWAGPESLCGSGRGCGVSNRVKAGVIPWKALGARGSFVSSQEVKSINWGGQARPRKPRQWVTGLFSESLLGAGRQRFLS